MYSVHTHIYIISNGCDGAGGWGLGGGCLGVRTEREDAGSGGGVGEALSLSFGVRVLYERLQMCQESISESE